MSRLHSVARTLHSKRLRALRGIVNVKYRRLPIAICVVPPHGPGSK